MLFRVGICAPGRPGSIIAVYAQTASGSFPGCHPVGARRCRCRLRHPLLLKTDRADDDGDLHAATADMEAPTSWQRSPASPGLVGAQHGPGENIVFACDAGMGSSAIGASVLRKKIQQAGFGDVKVTNQSIANLTTSYDLVVTHRDLTARAQ